MKKILLLSVLPLIIGMTLITNDNWKAKVDTAVFEAVQEDQKTEFMVLFNKQADLSKAALFRSKEDKGTYVYQQLKQLAQNSQQQAIQVLEKHNAPHRSFWIVNTLWSEGDIQLIQALAELPEVKGIHPNPKVHFDEPDYRAGNTNHGPLGIEWGITNTGADVVWAMGHTGQNVIVGGQDTGVEWDHPAIKDQYRGWDGSTANHDYNWHDAIHTSSGNPCGNDTTAPCDDHNHGTHTVGTMAGDDGGSNQIGMAPGAKWIACRNMDEGFGTPSSYIECFEWFLAPTNIAGNNPDPSKAPHVINNSWGCPPVEGCNPGNFATMEAAVNNLRSAGVVVVVSAGNSGSGCSSIDDPAAIFDGSFTVGATNSSNNIAGFSSRGHVTVDGSNRVKPDISAPGVSVRSCTRNNGYASWNGTSMAGPHVVGAIALMISADPSIAGNVDLIESTLTGSTLTRTDVQTCGGTSGSTIPNNTYGYGRVDALGAVNALLALPVELTDFYALTQNQQVRLFWQTAAEYNNDHFIIERSTNLSHWTAIGKVDAASVNNGPADYTFDDRTPKRGINYYRLQQTDFDGSFEYSKVVTAKLEDASNRLVLYPNPVQETLSLRFSEATTSRMEIQVFSSTGQMIQDLPLSAKLIDYEINTSNWDQGLYFIILRDEKGNVTSRQRIIKL